SSDNDVRGHASQTPQSVVRYVERRALSEAVRVRVMSRDSDGPLDSHCQARPFRLPRPILFHRGGDQDPEFPKSALQLTKKGNAVRRNEICQQGDAHAFELGSAGRQSQVLVQARISMELSR